MRGDDFVLTVAVICAVIAGILLACVALGIFAGV